jgi:hypothetical protein
MERRPDDDAGMINENIEIAEDEKVIDHRTSVKSEHQRFFSYGKTLAPPRGFNIKSLDS